MRDGSLSYERFCMEAELLQRRSHEVASRQDVDDGKCGVATWEWRHGHRQHLDGNSFLVSSGNSRHYQSNIHNKSAKLEEVMDRDTEELLQLEEVDWTDADQAPMTLQCQEVKIALLEFHIVYHTIYQTPVLYFRVSAVNGSPLPSKVVTLDAEFPGSNGRRSTFVAMEEHPVLGKPFSFLHPCETAAAMQLLQAQVQTDGSPSTLLNVEVPRYLASWLSLVQPLTAFSIRAKMTTRDPATRPRKKQRVGGAASSANTRGKFAFGSRLPIAEESLLKRRMKSGKVRLHSVVQNRQENAVTTVTLCRKRSRSSSQDSEEGTSRTKPSHRTLTVETALPPSSNLPALINTSHRLNRSRVSLSHLKREVLEEQERVADLDATEPAFWIKRRKLVETALKELDSIGKRIMAISSNHED